MDNKILNAYVDAELLTYKKRYKYKKLYATGRHRGKYIYSYEIKNSPYIKSTHKDFRGLVPTLLIGEIRFGKVTGTVELGPNSNKVEYTTRPVFNETQSAVSTAK